MPDDDLPPGFRPKDPTASDRAQTDDTDVLFTLKEDSRGEPWIAVEERKPGLPILRAGDAFLGLWFRSGVSVEQAQAFVREMNRMLRSLSYTKSLT